MERPSNDNEPEREWSVQDAITEIGVLRDQAMQEGAVDSERDQLTQLIIDVRNNAIDPAVAVEKARALIESRQSYH